jgi:transcriptional regulator with XRE-family HTH domain
VTPVVVRCAHHGRVVKLPRLRHVRERVPLTQRELAAMSGVHQTHIARIESGRLEPRPRTIRRLAEALGVEPRELMEPEGEP